MSGRNLAPGEWAVLALLCERPAHGWALARQLSPTGELGSIWSLTRPLVYRSLEILAARGLAEPSGFERGARGPNRVVYHATPAGKAALYDWLLEPVCHVRDVRSMLLLKLVFADRTGIDPEPMLLAQRAGVVEALASLEQRQRRSAGTDRILLLFRLESTRAVLRFVDGMLAEGASQATAVGQ